MAILLRSLPSTDDSGVRAVEQHHRGAARGLAYAPPNRAFPPAHRGHRRAGSGRCPRRTGSPGPACRAKQGRAADPRSAAAAVPARPGWRRRNLPGHGPVPRPRDPPSRGDLPGSRFRVADALREGITHGHIAAPGVGIERCRCGFRNGFSSHSRVLSCPVTSSYATVGCYLVGNCKNGPMTEADVSTAPVVLWSHPGRDALQASRSWSCCTATAANEQDLFSLAGPAARRFCGGLPSCPHRHGPGLHLVPADGIHRTTPWTPSSTRPSFALDWLDAVKGDHSSVTLLGFSMGMAMATTCSAPSRRLRRRRRAFRLCDRRRS